MSEGIWTRTPNDGIRIPYPALNDIQLWLKCFNSGCNRPLCRALTTDPLNPAK